MLGYASNGALALVRCRRAYVSTFQSAGEDPWFPSWASLGLRWVALRLVRYFPWHTPVPIECSAPTQEEGCVWAPGLLLPNSPGLARHPRRSSIDVPQSPPLCPHPLARVSRWGYASRVEITAGHEARCSGKGQANGRRDPSVGEQEPRQGEHEGCGSDSSSSCVFCMSVVVCLGTGVCPSPHTLARRVSCGCGMRVLRTGDLLGR